MISTYFVVQENRQVKVAMKDYGVSRKEALSQEALSTEKGSKTG